MFRISLAPKDTPGRNEKHILDLSYGDFNSFKIDLENRKLKIFIQPNCNSYSYEILEETLRQRWDIKKIDYQFVDGMVHIGIPENHEIIVQIK